jgi:pimeloyl-ACP methyl ester carboxylesterase
MSLAPEVRRGRVATGSGDLAALIGEPPATAASAAPVLLVPGYSGSKEDFLPVLGPLARAGHRTVAIDLRGQYESAGPDDPAAYSIDALAKDVTDVLSDLAGGDPSEAHLVGHSFGGLVTRAAVIAGTRPRTHVLVGSGPGALGGRRADAVPLLLQVAEESGARALADAVAELDKSDPRMAGVPAEVTAFLHERWARASVMGLRVMGDTLLSATDEVDALAEAGVRTLVVHGETDDAWPPSVQREMAERLGADYAVIPGSVHSPACEEPEGFLVALFGFWRT